MQQQPDIVSSRAIIIMGVAGSGKSTVSRLLAEKLNYRYLEGDDYHSAEAKAMMAAGIPLSDSLRESWVDLLCQQLQQCKAEGVSCVLSYSGLIARHRQKIREAGARVRFFYLYGSEALLASRLAARQNHFMPPGMLSSQLATMQPTDEEPDITRLDIQYSAEDVVAQICQQLAAEC